MTLDAVQIRVGHNRVDHHPVGINHGTTARRDRVMMDAMRCRDMRASVFAVKSRLGHRDQGFARRQQHMLNRNVLAIAWHNDPAR